MKLEEHRRHFLQVGLAVAVDRAHRQGVDKVRARDRHAELDGLDHRVGGVDHARKPAHRRRHRLRLRVQLDGHLGDHPQGAFAADEQAREVIARRRFLGAAPGLDDAPVGQHHGEAEHVFLHRAVAHGGGARGAGRAHAADGRVRARVDRKEQAGVLDMRVERLARHAGLHHRVEILGVHGQHAVHARQVDGHPAADRQDVAFERSAGAVGNHRKLVRGAGLDHRRDLLGGQRKHHRVGRRVGEVRFVVTVMRAHRVGDRHALGAERGPELVEQRGGNFAAQVFGGYGLVHGAFRWMTGRGDFTPAPCSNETSLCPRGNPDQNVIVQSANSIAGAPSGVNRRPAARRIAPTGDRAIPARRWPPGVETQNRLEITLPPLTGPAALRIVHAGAGMRSFLQPGDINIELSLNFIRSVSRLALMANAQHANQVRPFVKSVPGEIAASSARDDQFTQTTFNRATDARLMGQHLQSVHDEGQQPIRK